MHEEKESRFSRMMRTAAQCVKFAAGLALAGIVGVILIIAMMHLFETHPRIYAVISSVATLAVFVGMTTLLAKRGGDNGMEGMA